MSYAVNHLKNGIENVHRYCYTHTRTEIEPHEISHESK